MASEPAKSVNPTAALIAGVFLTLCLNPLIGVVMVVLAVVAIRRPDGSPEQARFTQYAWVAFAVGMILTALVVVLAIVLDFVPWWERPV
ncbi:hypothetical protein [Nocardiopsis aegyptia]|uniref:Putative membrane protein n=1 Tax=Nocardiopsis aegyptia TaxID=220378 RepID=A0A7Z0JB63_9ACTN|nr:hypothetical protein [Nocardiopsis aegyptia]NYJ35462.1 putative membrane protein [Nocardiopsis aegyptia]